MSIWSGIAHAKHIVRKLSYFFFVLRSYFCESANACAIDRLHGRPNTTGLLFLLFCDSPLGSTTCAPKFCDSLAIPLAIRRANALQPQRDRRATLGLSAPIPRDSPQHPARKSLICRAPRGRVLPAWVPRPAVPLALARRMLVLGARCLCLPLVVTSCQFRRG